MHFPLMVTAGETYMLSLRGPALCKICIDCPQLYSHIGNLVLGQLGVCCIILRSIHAHPSIHRTLNQSYMYYSYVITLPLTLPLITYPSIRLFFHLDPSIYIQCIWMF